MTWVELDNIYKLNYLGQKIKDCFLLGEQNDKGEAIGHLVILTLENGLRINLHHNFQMDELAKSVENQVTVLEAENIIK
jgi:hypothetical protein